MNTIMRVIQLLAWLVAGIVLFAINGHSVGWIAGDCILSLCIPFMMWQYEDLGSRTTKYLNILLAVYGSIYGSVTRTAGISITTGLLMWAFTLTTCLNFLRIFYRVYVKEGLK